MKNQTLEFFFLFSGVQGKLSDKTNRVQIGAAIIVVNF